MAGSPAPLTKEEEMAYGKQPKHRTSQAYEKPMKRAKVGKAKVKKSKKGY